MGGAGRSAWERCAGPGFGSLAAGGAVAHIRGMDTMLGCDLVVNGAATRVPEGLSVAGLLERLGLDRRKVAVERNEEIVPRSTYEAAGLSAGDRIEIVHFIGGG